MGLDMYLSKKTFLGGNYEHRKVKVNLEVYKEDKKAKTGVDSSKVTSIEEEVFSWRKANAIHQWFVDKCQDGRDECQEAHVTLEDLTELRDICKQIIDDNNLAEELLPTSSGFFFGSTEYDEWYFKNIKETYEMLDELIYSHNEASGFYVDYYYSSSW